MNVIYRYLPTLIPSCWPPTSWFRCVRCPNRLCERYDCKEFSCRDWAGNCRRLKMPSITISMRDTSLKITQNDAPCIQEEQQQEIHLNEKVKWLYRLRIIVALPSQAVQRQQDQKGKFLASRDREIHQRARSKKVAFRLIWHLSMDNAKWFYMPVILKLVYS